MDGIIDLPVENIGSNFVAVNSDIDYLNLSIASHYLSSKIKNQTKNLIKKTSSQMKNTAPFKEGMKLLDEIRTDISLTVENVENFQTSGNKQSEEIAFVEKIDSLNFADSHSTLDMVDGDIGAMQTFLSPLATDSLSTATTFITDIVTNEAKKIVNYTGDQIRKTSRFQESMKYFDDLCDEIEENRELRELKLDILKDAQMILNHSGTEDMAFDFSELFKHFICGLLDLKQHVSFFERNMSSSEISTFSDVVSLGLTKCYYVKSFRKPYNEEQPFFLNCNEGMCFSKQVLSLVKNTHSASGEISLKVATSDGKRGDIISSSETIYKSRKELQKHSSVTPTCHIHEILKIESERTTYDETLVSFIRFCSDLFVPEVLFSQLTLDYSIWRDLIKLFIGINERQIFMGSFEFGDESMSGNQVFISFHFIYKFSKHLFNNSKFENHVY